MICGWALVDRKGEAYAYGSFAGKTGTERRRLRNAIRTVAEAELNFGALKMAPARIGNRNIQITPVFYRKQPGHYSLMEISGQQDGSKKGILLLALDGKEAELATVFARDAARNDIWSQYRIDALSAKVQVMDSLCGYTLSRSISTRLFRLAHEMWKTTGKFPEGMYAYAAQAHLYLRHHAISVAKAFRFLAEKNERRTASMEKMETPWYDRV